MICCPNVAPNGARTDAAFEKFRAGEKVLQRSASVRYLLCAALGAKRTTFLYVQKFWR